MKTKLLNFILIIIISLLSLFIIFFSINCLNTDRNIIKSAKEIEKAPKFLALMLETTPASGEYQVSTDSVWPSAGYDFNLTLSKCENGSALIYDIVSNKVKVQSNKSDKCYVYFDKEILPVINNVTESNVTASAITLTVNATVGKYPLKTYYYSKDDGVTYVTTSSNSYTFNNLTDETDYKIKVKVEDLGGKYSVEVRKSVKTLYIFNKFLRTNYVSLGMNYHNSSLANGANDNSYRFSGANPNNYVCFGPGATALGQTCPEENQYRIIGVFGNQVKLIKKTSLGNKVWNSNNRNTWYGSTMAEYLNGEYLNSLTTTWSNKIAINTWQVGGLSYSNGVPATVYNYELGSGKINNTFDGKVGLMYLSDYGFAAQQQAWTLKILVNYDGVSDYSNPVAKANIWLFSNFIEWTISPNIGIVGFDDFDRVFFVNASTSQPGLTASGASGTRPVFYLQSSVNLIGGNGTAVDPYRI